MKEVIPLPNTGDLARLAKLKILAYGPQNSGKTRLMGTFPNLYIFNFEKDNLITLAYMGVKADYDDIDRYEHILEKIADLRKNCQYESIGVDSLTRMYEVIMSGVLKLRGKEHPVIQDWMLSHERLKLIIKQLKELPTHLICTALQLVQKDEETGTITGGIDMPGKMVEEIPPLFNMTLRMVAQPQADKAPIFYASTKPSSLFPAGDKTGQLPPRVEPDFKVIWDLINKEVR